MPGKGTSSRGLREVHTLPQLVKYLRDELGWPIEANSFEDLDEVVFDWGPEELGIDPESAAKIEYIKQLRPLEKDQPRGVFFVKFDTRQLPVVALRRILSKLVVSKRATARAAERPLWEMRDLVFISSYGEGDARQLSFAYFQDAEHRHDLPTLKVLGWDNQDTPLHLDQVHSDLNTHLSWPENPRQLDDWRKNWSKAFQLRHREVITTSKALSLELAKLARAIRDRIKTALAIETERGPLTKLMKAFQQALVHDLDADGFADMYAQTIAYGLLSARIADPKRKTADDFAAHMRTSPFLRELMQEFLKAGGRHGKAGNKSRGAVGIDFDELGVSDVMELLDDANMEAVLRDFGNRNRDEDPVMHFYESFLHEYNKQLKIQRGVFYTPQPVVSYIVRSVHELLQTEFGLADGLADTTTWGAMLKKHPGLKLPPLTDEPGEKRTISPDEPFVQILDPATGTATFLVEAIDVIYRTLAAKWKQQRLTDAQQSAAWNEYVPQHLLPRLHAFELMMAPYAIAHMKIGLKLAETGYRFGTEERARIYLTNALEPWVKQLPLIGFDALAHEAAEVNEIKRQKRFTIVLGNPPYSSVSSNRIKWSDELIEPFKKNVRQEETQIQALSDDYIRFIARGTYEVQRSGNGILAFITNNNYFRGQIFRDLREVLIGQHDDIRLLDLHGNSRLKETTLSGERDENVFDIVQGVGIGTFTKRPDARQEGAVFFRSDLWGSRSEKYQWLSANTFSGGGMKALQPRPPQFRFSADDAVTTTEYEKFVALTVFFGSGDFASDKTKRYGTGFKSQQDDFAVAFSKAEICANVESLLSARSESDLRELFSLCTTSQWSYGTARRELVRDRWPDLVANCLYRPFDDRWTVFHRGVISNLRVETMTHLFKPGGLALCTMRGTRSKWTNHAFVSSKIVSKDAVSLLDMCFVFPITRIVSDDSLLSRVGERNSNVNQKVTVPWMAALGGLSRQETMSDRETHIVNYIYAILYSPGYQSRYNDQLQKDFPRLPLTGNLELFRALARLGGELTALHLLESPKLAQPITEFIGARHPEVDKISWSGNTVWVDKAQATGFRGVREDVWNFHIGGYQVCEKWLKDRKGRKLLKDDISHYQKIVVALSETIRLMKEIDKVIDRHGGWPGAFATGQAAVAEPARMAAEPRPKYETP